MHKWWLNKYVKFRVEIPSRCWENRKRCQGLLYFAAPCSCNVKNVWSMPERFRGELLTMGRYTTPASFFSFYILMAAGGSQVPATCNVGHWNAVVAEIHRCLIPEQNDLTKRSNRTTNRYIAACWRPSVAAFTPRNTGPLQTSHIPLIRNIPAASHFYFFPEARIAYFL